MLWTITLLALVATVTAAEVTAHTALVQAQADLERLHSEHAEEIAQALAEIERLHSEHAVQIAAKEQELESLQKALQEEQEEREKEEREKEEREKEGIEKEGREEVVPSSDTVKEADNNKDANQRMHDYIEEAAGIPQIQHLVDDPDKVAAFLAEGAGLNWQDEHGMTPLNLAASKGKKKTVEYLLEMGADLNIRDFGGYGPLQNAASGGYAKVINTFHEAGLSISEFHPDGYAPLHYICHGRTMGHVRSFKFMMELGVDPELQSRHDPPQNCESVMRLKEMKTEWDRAVRQKSGEVTSEDELEYIEDERERKREASEERRRKRKARRRKRFDSDEL